IKPVAINACFIMFFLTEVLNCGFDFNGKKRLFKPPVKAGSNHSKSRNAEYGRWSELRPNVLSGLWRRLLILNGLGAFHTHCGNEKKRCDSLDPNDRRPFYSYDRQPAV